MKEIQGIKENRVYRRICGFYLGELYWFRSGLKCIREHYKEYNLKKYDLSKIEEMIFEIDYFIKKNDIDKERKYEVYKK